MITNETFRRSVGKSGRRRATTLNQKRRGSALVLSVFLIATLLMVAAVAIDFGHINVSRSEVKRTADAAAMAACWELFDGVVAGTPALEQRPLIATAADDIAGLNLVSSRSPSLNKDDDIEIGYYTTREPGVLSPAGSLEPNAVRVHLRQTDAVNSAIPLFFGAVTGRHQQSLETHSTAAMFKAVAGFHVPDEEGECLDILPITLDLATWEKVCAKQTEDKLSWDPQANEGRGGVVNKGDGFCECSLYPEPTDDAAGNRGTVDIGGGANSTTDISRQIMTGISAADMAAFQAEGGTLEFDSNGECVLNGDTGISAAIKDELHSIVGQTRIIPIFKEVGGNGDNAQFTIVAWEGVRILGVKLTGPMHKKHLTIQPARMVAKHAIYSEDEFAETDFLYTPVMLVD
ncbi:pilus assembly protein TadG-related protein [Roseiconus nitratireducens]|nr:pilus assembly protein TadG-related protein [Roseiconus nitratireducens]